MSIHKTEALVLKTFDFRETSIIAALYTRDFGRIQGLFKGIRTEPAKFGSTLEPFSHNEIVFYQKRNAELHLVSACDIKENFSALRSDISKCGQASFMMELLHAVTALEDKSVEVFDLTTQCLSQMSANPNYNKIPTIYKIKLLSLTGFRPHLHSCLSCGDKISSQAKFSNYLGGLICQNCFKRDIRAAWIFRGTIASILHIEKNSLIDSLRLGINPQIKRELDCILNSFIEFHLEKKFKTQRVLPFLEESAKKVLA